MHMKMLNSILIDFFHSFFLSQVNLLGVLNTKMEIILNFGDDLNGVSIEFTMKREIKRDKNGMRF